MPSTTHVDDAFLGWADTWLLPEFRSWSIEDLLPAVRQPMLLIKAAMTNTARSPSSTASRPASPAQQPGSCSPTAATPQRDQEAAVLDVIAAFAREHA